MAYINRMLDPTTQQNESNLIRQRQQMAMQKNQESVDPAVADRIEYINTRWPHIPPEQQLVLAKSYASDDAIDQLGEMSGRQMAAEMSNEVLPEVRETLKYMVSAGSFTKKAMGAALRNTLGRVPMIADTTEKINNFLSEQFVDPFVKPVSRGLFAALDAVPETINNLGAMISKTERFDKAPSNRTVKGFFDSLSIVTMFDNMDDVGEGFLISQEIRDEQARRARQFRGEIYGSAYTIGRGAAQVFYKENSEGFRRTSGFVDALINIAAPDPTKLVKKGFTAVRGTTPLLTLDEAAEFRSLVRSGIGIDNGIGGASLNVQKFNDFIEKSGIASKFVDRLVEEDDVLKIAEDYFDWDITNDMAIELAGAKTRDEVKAALTTGWTISGQAVPGELREYAAMARKNQIIERTLPFVRNSRAMRKVPGSQVVIHGTSAERAQGARNMINSLRAAGATTDEVKEIAPRIINALSSGKSSDDIKAAHDVYKDTLRLILRKNGITDEVIGDVVDGGYERMTQLRSYMIDRAGNETDFGFSRAMFDQFRDAVPDEYIDAVMEMYNRSSASGFVTIDRPLQMVELLDKVLILPDARELRRLTRNPFVRELLQSKTAKELLNPEAVGTDLPAIKKGSMLNPFGTSRVARREVEFVPVDKQGEYKGYMDEIQRIKESKNGLPLTPDDYDDIEDLTRRAEALKTGVRKEFVATGEQRAVYEFIEQFQNKVWKAFTLATGGYVIRNAMDAQIRMHFGAETGIFHPADYIMLLSGKKRSKAITGADITGGGFKIDDTTLKALRDDHMEFLTGAASRQLLDNTDNYRRLYGTGQWTDVTRADGVPKHTQGMIQNLRQINKDPLQSIVARGRVLGLDEEEIFKEFKAAASSDKIFKELKSQARSYPFVSSDGTKVRLAPIDIGMMSPEDLDKWFRMLFDTYITGNVGLVTGKMTELEFMAAFDRVPMLDKRAWFTADELRPVAKGTNISIGSEVLTHPTKVRGVVVGFKGGQYDVIPVHSGSALDGMYGSRAANRKIRSIKQMYQPATDTSPEIPGLPTYIRREVVVGDPQDKEWFARTQAGLDRVTDAFFGTFYDKKFVRYFERSPVYRQFYYEGVSKIIDRVKPESADRVYTSLLAKAQKENMTVGQYIGDEAVAKVMRDAAYKKTGVDIGANVRDIDDYARMYALGKAKELLYNGAERNNLVDVFRVIAPFANAWREVLGTYLTQFSDDAFRVARSAQRVYTGAKNADPDRDGRGFFYNDPRTGDLMFTFPFSDDVSRLALKLAGAPGEPGKVTLEAPVKQLSQGLNVLPALGPMAQFVAGSVLPDNADYAEIRKVLLPYGEKSAASVFNPTPGWFKKMAEAIDGDVNATGTVFANSYIEAARARMAMGGYDINTEEGLERLKKDARRDAQLITAMRGFSQFLGPTAGRAEFTVKTERGDAIVGEVLKFFQDLQEQDYDTSVQRFIEILGDDMQLYVGSKARSLRDGLESNEEFGLWQLDNEDLLQGRFKDVASYFAPSGSEMNFDVYNSQIKKGFRERLTFDELVEVAQQRIGSALYSDARRMFGPYRNEMQSDMLRRYRSSLHKRYPGFPLYVQFTTNQLENQIQLLGELADESRMSGNPLVGDLKKYLALREQIKQRTGATTTLSGKKRLPFRQMLHAYGEDLAVKNPYFDRLWNRLLVQEVDE